MSTIRRIFVEKKDAFAVEAHGLLSDLRNNLGMKNLTGIRILNRYDVMGVSDEEFAAARKIVLSEPPVDTVTEKFLKCLQAAVLLPWNIFPDNMTKGRILPNRLFS